MPSYAALKYVHRRLFTWPIIKTREKRFSCLSSTRFNDLGQILCRNFLDALHCSNFKPVERKNNCEKFLGLVATKKSGVARRMDWFSRVEHLDCWSGWTCRNNRSRTS